MPPHQRHYLLTGGAGFIGSHLAEDLLRNGHSVSLIDNLSTGSYRNIEHLEREHRESGRFKFIFDSVLHERVVEELVREADAIFHLASAVGVRLIMEEPVRTIETIFGGTDVVLRCAARYRRKVMIFSTSEVYGKSEDVPFREDGDRLEGPTTRHRWAYACAKALDEFLALAHWKQNRLPVVVVRLFNTVGPRQTGQYGMVLPTFVRRALAGEPLLVHGDGTQTRCFCHVEDVVRAVSLLIEEKDAHGQVFNVGATEEVTIADLAQRIVSATGSLSPVRLVPYAAVFGSEGFEDMVRRVPSIEKVRALTGWEPTWGLDDIISSVAEHAKSEAPEIP